jgi:hypothetical protein
MAGNTVLAYKLGLMAKNILAAGSSIKGME